MNVLVRENSFDCVCGEKMVLRKVRSHGKGKYESCFPGNVSFGDVSFPRIGKSTDFGKFLLSCEANNRTIFL